MSEGEPAGPMAVIWTTHLPGVGSTDHHSRGRPDGRQPTEGKDDMGKRFAIVIGVAATGVMALGAQTAAAPSDVVKYDTKVTIAEDRRALYHGFVKSEVKKCMDGRRVVVFNRQDGADRKLGTTRSDFERGRGGVWGFHGTHARHVYAKVRREVHDGFVCRGDLKNLKK
jgi:hypothetical protein